MATTEPKKPGPSPLGVRRKAVEASSEAWVRTRSLRPQGGVPFLVEPALDGVDLGSWAAQNRERIEAWLREHRALLFRGFRVSGIADFQRFARATSDGEFLEYRDRSTPRETLDTKVYSSTVYPADQVINLHNEGTYWKAWPAKIFFCCLTAPRTGGETPIADVRRVHDHVDPEIRDAFARKKVMYVRNYNDGFGLPWPEVFQTTDRAEVEAYCRANDISFEWKDGDRLRTRQVRPAIRVHPRTGEKLWFNHGAFFHWSALEPAAREFFAGKFDVADFPYNTYYGDGTPIDPDVVAHILDAYRREKVVFGWEEGDVLMMDNMSVAHAREAYTGERKIVVAMTESLTD
ncbi:MAG TPA: TauD/TfdA family dioxygenase [Vicinamibacteria bacterium]